MKKFMTLNLTTGTFRFWFWAITSIIAAIIIGVTTHHWYFWLPGGPVVGIVLLGLIYMVYSDDIANFRLLSNELKEFEDIFEANSAHLAERLCETLVITDNVVAWNRWNKICTDKAYVQEYFEKYKQLINDCIEASVSFDYGLFMKLHHAFIIRYNSLKNRPEIHMDVIRCISRSQEKMFKNMEAKRIQLHSSKKSDAEFFTLAEYLSSHLFEYDMIYDPHIAQANLKAAFRVSEDDDLKEGIKMIAHQNPERIKQILDIVATMDVESEMKGIVRKEYQLDDATA